MNSAQKCLLLESPTLHLEYFYVLSSVIVKLDESTCRRGGTLLNPSGDQESIEDSTSFPTIPCLAFYDTDNCVSKFENQKTYLREECVQFCFF